MKRGARESLWRALALVSGLSLFAAYLSLELGLPRGPAEFAYWPPLEPLPFAPVRGFTWEQGVRFLARMVVLGPALVLVSLGLVHLWPERWTRWRPRRVLVGSVAIGTLLLAWAIFGLYQGRALVDDELSYSWQAELLAEGRIFEDRLPEWGPEQFTIWTEWGATGKYLFGVPLLQIPGVLLGWPALVHLPLFLLTLGLWYRVVRADQDPSAAAWATALVALSPMVLLTGGTGMSHLSSLLCMVAMGYGLLLVREGREWGGALLAGTALGLAATIRLQVALPFGGVLALFVVGELVRRRRLAPLLGLAGGALPWLVAIALYDLWVTGSMTSLPWSLYRPREDFGFGQVVEGSTYVHGPLRALENLLVVALRLNLFLLGWPFSLALLLVWWRIGRPLGGAAPWLAASLGLVLFNVGYYSPGVGDTGALYHFELVLPFALLGGIALAHSLERWPRLASALLVSHLLLGTGSFLWEQGSRIDRMLTIIHAPVERALERVEPPALVLYEIWPSEAFRLGWLNAGFPKRWRASDAPIVTYPRTDPQVQAALRESFPERSCWYYRVDPARLLPEIRRCSEVEALLERPARLPGPWIAFRPTAMARGLLPAPDGGGR